MLITNVKIAIAQLVYFITVAPLIIYCLWIHGRRKCLGWLFLFFFATVRVISSILTISQKSRIGPPITAVQVVSGIAISPLLVGVGGVMHESYVNLSSRQLYAVFSNEHHQASPLYAAENPGYSAGFLRY